MARTWLEGRRLPQRPRDAATSRRESLQTEYPNTVNDLRAFLLEALRRRYREDGDVLENRLAQWLDFVSKDSARVVNRAHTEANALAALKATLERYVKAARENWGSEPAYTLAHEGSIRLLQDVEGELRYRELASPEARLAERRLLKGRRQPYRQYIATLAAHYGKGPGWCTALEAYAYAVLKKEQFVASGIVWWRDPREATRKWHGAYARAALIGMR